MEVQQAADAMFEVSVAATVTTKIKDRTVFLVEVKQAGIFEIRNLPADQMQAVMGIACPQIIYPYLRSNVADVITRAGFPAMRLSSSWHSMTLRSLKPRLWPGAGMNQS